MPTITATELARNLRKVLDQIEFRHESVTIIRNRREIARILPGPQVMTAEQAFIDIYGVVGEEAGQGWATDSLVSEENLEQGIRDPWAT